MTNELAQLAHWSVCLKLNRVSNTVLFSSFTSLCSRLYSVFQLAPLLEKDSHCRASYVDCFNISYFSLRQFINAVKRNLRTRRAFLVLRPSWFNAFSIYSTYLLTFSFCLISRVFAHRFFIFWHLWPFNSARLIQS